jgi:hypothetical protein
LHAGNHIAIKGRKGVQEFLTETVGAKMRQIRLRLLRGFAPGAGGVVVRVRGLLGGALIFGDVAEIDADAVPDGAGASHAVDENVVFGEVGSGFGVFFFPASEAGFGGGFVGGLRDDDEWVFGGAAGWGFAGFSGVGRF